MHPVIKQIFKLSDDIRYVAIYQNGKLQMKSKSHTKNSSDNESDKYEELLINPLVLLATKQRGEIDCGGLDYVLIRYGNFFQYVQPISCGHISVCLDKDSDIKNLSLKIQNFCKNK
ncbi:MAG: hypothetical protein DRQ51_04765 [Gammaproteobacteria bacterium]|nr:MAG: hypothetical protein DRQ51_04765 [Gammaproteobacteria bacterium]